MSSQALIAQGPVIPAPAEVAESRPRRSPWRKKLETFQKRMGYVIDMAAPMVLPILPNRGPAGEVKIGSRTVRYYRHLPSDEGLLSEWDELSRSVPGATVFQSTAWQKGIVRSADALGTLRLLTVRNGARLTGVLPLERKWGNLWRTPGMLTTAYHDPLVHPDHADETWAALLNGAAQFGMRSMSLQLLSPDAACLKSIPAAAAGAGYKMTDEVAMMGTAIPFAPTWDEYLAGLDGHDRKELRRKIKKAQEKGAAKLVVNESEADVRAALPGVFALMERAGGGKGNKTKWLYRTHFESATELARSGRLVVYQLFCEGRLAAGLISLPQQKQQTLWGCAIDSDLQQWSPGIVLFGMVFRRAIENGEQSIDLLRGTFSYKYTLGAVDRAMHRLTLTR
jgi:CelD/BcsL family acetyltransferase involved in cellulose biosynthesis